MKKRCNIYIDEENVNFLHEKNINISKLTNDLLSFYIDLLNMSENEMVKIREKLNDEIMDKTMKLTIIDKRLLELADEVGE